MTFNVRTLNRKGQQPELTVSAVENYIEFTRELDVEITKIKNRKAAGLEEIPPEVWKTRKFDDTLLRCCNAV